MPIKTSKKNRSSTTKKHNKEIAINQAATSSIQRFLVTSGISPDASCGQTRCTRRTTSLASLATFERKNLPTSSYCSDLMEEPESPTASDMSSLLSGIRKELAGMFYGLETSIKKEIAGVRTDMAHILDRVEDTEKRQDTHENAIRELQQAVTQIALAHRVSLYKLEDLENRNRRNNLRIRGLPEATGDKDLEPSITGIFNSVLGKAPTDLLRFDRVHRAYRPRNIVTEQPRDVICRLHYFSDKNAIMDKMRSIPNIDFDGATLTIFSDLSKETLDRRRGLKPLLEHLRSNGITYRWGFPACLIATKNGRSHTLRFPEELPQFLKVLDLPSMDLPGWHDPFPKVSHIQDSHWQKPSTKKGRSSTRDIEQQHR